MASRDALSGLLGTRFGGKRDYYKVYGYEEVISFEQYLAKYRRQDIAKRVVNAPAFGTWSGAPTLDGGSDFNTAWTAFLEAYPSLWAELERADRLSGIGQFGILLLGFDDGRPLDQPVGSATKILYFQPYMQNSVTQINISDDTRSDQYGLPQLYHVQNPAMQSYFGQSPATSIVRQVPTPEIGLKIHASRILHIAEGTLESPVLGTPRLEAVFNLLDDLIKISGGSAETFWLESRKGIHVNVDKDMTLDTGDPEALQEEIDDYVNNLSRMIRTKGVTVQALGSDVADPRGAFDVTISLISGTSGIPKRILIGSEAGQLASQQDRSNWAERIHERRIDFAEPDILRQFITKCQGAGLLPEATPAVEWPSGFFLDPLEEAQSYAQLARSAANFAKAGETGAEFISEEEARRAMGLPDEMPPNETPLAQSVDRREPAAPFGNQPGREDEDEESDEERRERETQEEERANVQLIRR